ncbi:hypothetical protein Taro_051744 [Colocasia esculenta]|uniref:Alpha-mannosidase n=1 Tax=Colocasia esculenta TaxID=4460 RepID=A0A843XGQ1_COLES|nr:hypothetical protein [Colocasia esculenta]
MVKGLVSSGQLEFINGGMCMHDEAATHYVDMIDQTTLGHRFIEREFGRTPRIGWQIDPFGHSAVQAYLLSAQVGFDALFFSRIDYQDMAKRKNDKTLEIIWRGSQSLGSSADIFTGVLPNGYEPPRGFYFEVNDDAHIVQDDINLFDYNVEERVNDFVEAAMAQANITRTNHIMWTMGTDFKYQYATTWFRQLDKLIHYVNMDGRVNALYSTPSIYVDAKHASNESWPLKTEDFFPYADREGQYWTGYFTSRPALKGYVRTLSAYYLAARQLEFLRGRKSLGLTTDALADALAIAQHHDAVTGTEQQHVANDYVKRLSIGYSEAEKLVASALGCLSESSSGGDCQNPSAKFEQCPLLNISYCPPSEVHISQGTSLVILVYNPLGWKRDDVIRIPVTSESVIVRDSEGRDIESQLVPVSNVSLGIRNFYVKAYLGMSPSATPKFWLVFPVSVAPLGFTTYFVVSSTDQSGYSAVVSDEYTSQGSENSPIEVGQGNLKLTFSEGKLSHYMNTRSLVNQSIQQSYGYYTGDEWSYQGSGAYVFLPDSMHHVQSTDQVGPIPIDDKTGKEVVTQITTNINNNKTFHTDSNGRDFIRRIRDYRSDWDLEVNQPISGNYYPINLGIFMEDNSTEMSVLVDRPVGGSSVLDGQLELMLHRRLLRDDGKGVAEALNEMVYLEYEHAGLTIQGKFYLRIDPSGDGAKWRRSIGQEMYSPLLLAFSKENEVEWTKSHVPIFTAMDPSYSLPDNVAIVTLEELEDGSVILRLAHLYELGEDKDFSVMTKVYLRKLFPRRKISKVKEMNLSANQERSEMEKKRLLWKIESSSSATVQQMRGGPIEPFNLVVELGPMEIRTFVITFSYTTIHTVIDPCIGKPC